MRKLRTSSSVSSVNLASSVNIVSQLLDMIKGVQGDVSQVVTEYNSEVWTTLSTLPQGRSDTRWRLTDDSICPRVNGIDGSQIFVDIDASAATGNDLFWDDSLSRPATIKEFLEDLYSSVQNAINSLSGTTSSSVPTLTVYDEGTEIEDSVGSVDFRGAGVTVVRTDSGAIRVTIPAASAEASVPSFYPMTRCNVLDATGEMQETDGWQGGCIFDASLVPDGFLVYFTVLVYCTFDPSGATVSLWDIEDADGGGIGGGTRKVSEAVISGSEAIVTSRTVISIVGAAPATGQIMSQPRTYMVHAVPSGDGPVMVSSAGFEIRPAY